MTRVSLRLRDGETVTADYEAHELMFMKMLRNGLDGPDSEWNRDTMFLIHELKATFPGSVLTRDNEVIALSKFDDTTPTNVV